jgi:hypothetical protein
MIVLTIAVAKVGQRIIGSDRVLQKLLKERKELFALQRLGTSAITGPVTLNFEWNGVSIAPWREHNAPLIEQDRRVQCTALQSAYFSNQRNAGFR